MNRGVVGMVLACVLAAGVVEPALGQEVRRVTLDEALGLARRHNPTLEQALSAVEVAEFNRLNAWGQFLPNLSLSYSTTIRRAGAWTRRGRRSQRRVIQRSWAGVWTYFRDFGGSRI